MNPIQYAVDQVLLRIPRPILERAFLNNIPYQNAVPDSLSSRIREEVIERRVRTDCNLIGGHQIDVPLINVPQERIDPFNTIVRVPKSHTQGRTITRALSLVFSEGAVLGHANLSARQTTPLVDAASGVMSSQMPIPPLSTHKLTMIGENVVLIKDNYALPRNIYLRCWVEHDEDMTHLEPTSYRDFAQLVIYATQSWIYNTLIVELDRGAIHAGSELGRIREIIEEYSDAEENYDDYFREKWRRVQFLNDNQAKMRHIKLATGGLH